MLIKCTKILFDYPNELNYKKMDLCECVILYNRPRSVCNFYTFSKVILFKNKLEDNVINISIVEINLINNIVGMKAELVIACDSYSLHCDLFLN